MKDAEVEEQFRPDITMFGDVVSVEGDWRKLFGIVHARWTHKRWLYEGVVHELGDGACTWEWKLKCAGVTVVDMVEVSSLEIAVEELNKKARDYHDESLWFDSSWNSKTPVRV